VDERGGVEELKRDCRGHDGILTIGCVVRERVKVIGVRAYRAPAPIAEKSPKAFATTKKVSRVVDEGIKLRADMLKEGCTGVEKTIDTILNEVD
jgi:hypothetical protein